MAIGTALYSPANWADMDAIHALFAELRQSDPVHFVEDEAYGRYWHITKHADIFEIEKRSDVFANAPRVMVMPLQVLAMMEQAQAEGLHTIRTLSVMDAPEHMKMRLLTQSWFMPKNLQKLQGSIDASASFALETLAKRGGECDFARDIALEYPLRVIMAVMGVGEEHYSMMLRLTQELLGSSDPDLKREGLDPGDMKAIHTEYIAFFQKLTEEKRANPANDLTSLIANAEVDGKPLGFNEQLGYYVIAATAGHDTTSFTLTEAVHQLARNPQLLEQLKADPAAMAEKVADEAIRYAAAVRHFCRTAKVDFQLRGKTIKAGDPIILWYPSGSRDEEIFSDPNRFDPHRDVSARHASFGHGAHICLGMHLARKELTSFLKHFAERVEVLELTGSARYTEAHFLGGIKSLPIKARLKHECVA